MLLLRIAISVCGLKVDSLNRLTEGDNGKTGRLHTNEIQMQRTFKIEIKIDCFN